jgi:hypothetical protein
LCVTANSAARLPLQVTGCPAGRNWPRRVHPNKRPPPLSAVASALGRYCCKSLRARGATFLGPCRCPSKKHVGVHSAERSRHQRLRQSRGDGYERRFPLTPAFTSICAIPDFSTFATISTTNGLMRRRQTAPLFNHQISGGLRRSPFPCIRGRDRLPMKRPEDKSYSITSSAMARSCGGTARSRRRAVSALMTSSNFDDCTTGRSAGFSPLRMRPV